MTHTGANTNGHAGICPCEIMQIATLSCHSCFDVKRERERERERKYNCCVPSVSYQDLYKCCKIRKAYLLKYILKS